MGPRFLVAISILSCNFAFAGQQVKESCIIFYKHDSKPRSDLITLKPERSLVNELLETLSVNYIKPEKVHQSILELERAGALPPGAWHEIDSNIRKSEGYEFAIIRYLSKHNNPLIMPVASRLLAAELINRQYRGTLGSHYATEVLVKFAAKTSRWDEIKRIFSEILERSFHLSNHPEDVVNAVNYKFVVDGIEPNTHLHEILGMSVYPFLRRRLEEKNQPYARQVLTPMYNIDRNLFANDVTQVITEMSRLGQDTEAIEILTVVRRPTAGMRFKQIETAVQVFKILGSSLRAGGVKNYVDENKTDLLEQYQAALNEKAYQKQYYPLEYEASTQIRWFEDRFFGIISRLPEDTKVTPTMHRRLRREFALKSLGDIPKYTIRVDGQKNLLERFLDNDQLIAEERSKIEQQKDEESERIENFFKEFMPKQHRNGAVDD